MLAWAFLPNPPSPAINLYITCCSDYTTTLERSTCPNQLSLLSLKMRSRSSSSRFASSSLYLTVAISSGLMLQICLIMGLSMRCRFVLVAKFHWHGAWRPKGKSCIHGRGSSGLTWTSLCGLPSIGRAFSMHTFNQDLVPVVVARCISYASKVCSRCSGCCCCLLLYDRQRMGIRLNCAGGTGLYHRS